MSLRQFINTLASRAQLAPFLQPLERWRPPPAIRVPRCAQSKRSGRVSTAVDTAIRIELGRRRPDALEWPWMAEHALALAAPTVWTLDGIRPFAPVVRDRFFAALGAARLYRELEAPGTEDLRRLARASLDLATLDALGRAGRVFGDAMAIIQPGISEEEVDEVMACLEICPWELFECKGPLLLGPDFGDYAGRVSGADADVIAGERLVEIKCVDSSRIDIEELRQLFGYFLLSELIADDHGPRARVQELYLYFARHGRAYPIDAATLRAMPGFEELKRWMRKQACRGDAPQCHDQERITAREYTSRRLVVHRRAKRFFGTKGEPEDARGQEGGRRLDAIEKVEALAQRKLRRSHAKGAPPGDFGLFLRWFDKGPIEVFHAENGDAAPEGTSTPLGSVNDLPVELLGGWLDYNGADLGVGAQWNRRKYRPFECAWVLPGNKCHAAVWRLAQ